MVSLMIKLLSFISIFLYSSLFYKPSPTTMVQIETTFGNITIILYNDTKLHKENFIKLVREGYYDGLLFHRVIPDFMIQTGDSDSKTAVPGQALGSGGPAYTIPAEFFPSYFHKRGAVAAARMADNVNPEKASSASQFYIVQGTVCTRSLLSTLERTGKHLPFTEEQIKIYTSIGGTPQLDNFYTVFGEVTEGLDIVQKISMVLRDPRNRPITDIKIIKAYILE